jgi:pimeloyl-ACP methyl ester carboxylesterase
MGSDLTQIPPQGRFAAVNGMQMYYEEHGDGPPLLLLHGFAVAGLGWRPFIPEFAKHFRVIMPNLRGHGRSLDPTNQFTFAQTALDVFALLDQLGIERFKAIGNSGGGLTLQYLAAQQPARLEAIILKNCGTIFSEQTRVFMLDWADGGGTDWEMVGQKHLEGVAQVRSLANQVPKIMNHQNTYPPDLSKITARTLIIFGDRDEMMSVETPVEMYSLIPNSYLWIVPNAGHDVFGDDPDKHTFFIRTALGFLQDTW